MDFFSHLLGPKLPQSAPREEPLVPAPIPALGVLLLHLEKQKGAPLTEEEVTFTRDKAVCMPLAQETS